MKLAIVKLSSKRETGLGTALSTSIRRRVKTDELNAKGKNIFRKEEIPWDDMSASETTNRTIQNVQFLVPGCTTAEAKAIVWKTMFDMTNAEAEAQRAKGGKRIAVTSSPK